MAAAQTTPPGPPASAARPDTAGLVADTLASDSLRVASAPQGDIATTITYKARDSIRFDVTGRIVHLYGDAEIVYGSMILNAGYIQINWGTNIMTAAPLTDSAGNETGIPVFKDDPEMYTAKKIAYNYRTKRGRVSDVVTQQGEGYIHGETIKKNEFNELYIHHAQYTTCNLAHPHFYFNANRLKVIPEKRIYSGPFNLVVGDVPTPLGFVFGLFPVPKKRSSGVVVPTFGETATRGFFLRNGGVYLAVNDYIGTQLLGEVYSLGGYGVQSNTQYFKRYSYQGNFSLRSNFRPASSFRDLPPSRQKKQQDYWIDWQHSPIVRRGGRFSANVNAGTPGFNQNNSWNTQNYLAATFNSTINYSKQIENSPFSYAVGLRQMLNTQTRVQEFTLPDVNFSMSSIQPFANVGRSGSWYRNTRISYTGTGQNQITNVTRNLGPNYIGPTPDTLDLSQKNFSTILNNSRNGIQHTIPITTSFKALRFFTISPNITYNETWNFRRYNYEYIPDSNRIAATADRGFHRVYSYSAGANMNTRIYGVYFIKGKKLEAIRHMISPNLGFAYRPDFGRPRYGYYQRNVQLNNQGTVGDISRYQGTLYGAPSRGEQANIILAVSNNLEAKVRAREDTTGNNPFDKFSLIDNFDFSTAYNLAADSFRLAEINTNLRTTLFKVWNINMNAAFDPYRLNLQTGRRVERLFFQDSFGGPRLTRAGLMTGVNLNPQVQQRNQPTPVTTPADEALARSINNNPDLYVDFTVPWNLSVQYNLNYFRRVRMRGDSTRFEQVGQFSNALSLSGEVNLTSNWKLGAFTGYDFDNKEISYTTVSIYRDLHCWEMGLTWIPFGQRQSYAVTINAKASMLQDLRLQRNRFWYDR